MGSSSLDTPAYGGHSVYLFSTLDDPAEASAKTRTPSPILSPNSKQQKTGDGSSPTELDDHTNGSTTSTADGRLLEDDDARMDESGDAEEREEEEDEEDEDEAKYSDIPLVLPRRSFKGMSNLRTIKDGALLLVERRMLDTDGWIFCS